MAPVSSEPHLRATGGTTSPVGTVDAGVLAHVDAAGAVEPVGAGWTLDWWVGAEDRWHHPSVEASVRQRTLEDTPVVHTAVRVPGGDVVSRAGGVVATVAGAAAPAVLVEFENLSAVPVALALVVRPLRAEGPGRVVAARVHGATVVVDGASALRLDRPVARVVLGRCVPSPAADVVSRRIEAAEDRLPPAATEDRDGRAEVAAVVPLAHAATVRVLVGAAGPVDDVPWTSPTLDEVVTGWEHHLGRLASLDLGVPGWAAGVRAACSTLLLAGPAVVADCLRRHRGSAGPTAAGRAAGVCEAACRVGAVDLLPPVARGLAIAQRLGGACRLGDGSDGSVALLWAAAGVLSGPAAAAHADELVAPVAVAIRRVGRRGPGQGVDPGSAAWALRAVAPGLLAIGQPEVAADAVTVAGRVAADTGSRDVDPGGVVDPVADLVAPDGPVRVRDRDAAPVAALLAAALRSVVVDSADGVSILPVFPESWRGLPADVRNVHTAWGLVSWSLRWHGARPALLWEVEPAVGLGQDPAPTVRAPGLDRDWEGRGWAGEALLDSGGAGPTAVPGPPGGGLGGGDPGGASFS